VVFSREKEKAHVRPHVDGGEKDSQLGPQREKKRENKRGGKKKQYSLIKRGVTFGPEKRRRDAWVLGREVEGSERTTRRRYRRGGVATPYAKRKGASGL